MMGVAMKRCGNCGASIDVAGNHQVASLVRKVIALEGADARADDRIAQIKERHDEKLKRERSELIKKGRARERAHLEREYDVLVDEMVERAKQEIIDVAKIAERIVAKRLRAHEHGTRQAISAIESISEKLARGAIGAAEAARLLRIKAANMTAAVDVSVDADHRSINKFGCYVDKRLGFVARAVKGKTP